MNGTVLPHQLTLFSEPNTKSKILQYKKKGDVIYIHGKDISESPHEPEFETLDDIDQIDSAYSSIIRVEGEVEDTPHSDNEEDFYKTLDRSGADAYVLKRHIKLIYKDKREGLEKISPFATDETDYRLEEPLPKGYPFVKRKLATGFFEFGIGPQIKSSYPYPAVQTKERYRIRRGVHIGYMRNANFDIQSRFFVGAFFQAHFENAEFEFSNSQNSLEIGSIFGAGPILSYDAYKGEKLDISFYAAIPINYEKRIIQQEDLENFEERIFSGFGITPTIGSNLKFLNVLGSWHLTASFELLTYLPYYLRNSNNFEVDNGNFWDEEQDYIYRPFRGVMSAYIGVSSTF